MQDLVDFAIKSVADHPDQVNINLVEGKSSLLFEVTMADDDRARMLGNDRALWESLQAVISASSGHQRAVIDLVDSAPVDPAPVDPAPALASAPDEE